MHYWPLKLLSPSRTCTFLLGGLDMYSRERNLLRQKWLRRLMLCLKFRTNECHRHKRRVEMKMKMAVWHDIYKLRVYTPLPCLVRESTFNFIVLPATISILQWKMEKKMLNYFNNFKTLKTTAQKKWSLTLGFLYFYNLIYFEVRSRNCKIT